MSEWKTSEILEFLNSYNRVYKDNPEEALKYRIIYVLAFAELHKRSPLLSILY